MKDRTWTQLLRVNEQTKIQSTEVYLSTDSFYHLIYTFNISKVETNNDFRSWYMSFVENRWFRKYLELDEMSVKQKQRTK